MIPDIWKYKKYSVYITFPIMWVFVKLLSKDFATEVDLVQEISNSLTNQELERIATLIIEVIESKAEIVDNRSFYY